MAKLGEVCTIVSGSTPKTSVTSYWDGNIKWITPAELNEDTFYIMDSVRHITEEGKEKTGLSYLPTGTVILSSRAPIGKTAIAGCEMCCNQGFKNLICSDAIYNEYLYFFLKSKTDYLNSLGRGATFKEISKSIVESIEIPLPEVNQQKEIAEKFKKLEQLISLRKQQLAKLDELVKARFVEMFGDPADNVNNLPASPMTAICQIIDGDRGKNYPKQEEFSDSGFCLFLNAKNVTAQGFSFENCTYITEEKDALLRNGKLCRGDVVLTTRGTIGNLAFYDTSVPYENIRINSGMGILRMNKQVVSEIFFIEQFKMQLDSIKSRIASGSAQPQLPISTMNKIEMILPPIELQNQFAAFVERVSQQKQTVQQSLEKLELMKKALMQEYFG
ncbi:restriction endonuclease subunit S [Faecalibacterium sp. i20-0019-C2]|uniref:restriction endonuclease subunit S n=1 Tax=unclassified Faecalibacterium TaxID=2646395 RepID=UPI0034BADDA6